MRLIKSGEVQALTGLSVDQLREWTGRRALIKPDVQSQGKGTHARFSWQTVLVLRLAVVLKDQFHIELQAHRDLLAGLQQEFASTSFLSLREKMVVVYGKGQWEILNTEENGDREGLGAILLFLAPHLGVLSGGFGMPDPSKQLTLFPVVGVENTTKNIAQRPSPNQSAGQGGYYGP